MPRARRVTAGLLLAGLFVAEITPWYLVHVRPVLAGYLLHPAIFLIQAVPYVVCAALWLPWRSEAAGRAAVVVSSLVLATALVAHLPMLVGARHMGGDMIGLAFVGTAAATSVVVLAASVVAAVAMWWRRGRR
jgi:hypothetical protein